MTILFLLSQLLVSRINRKFLMPFNQITFIIVNFLYKLKGDFFYINDFDDALKTTHRAFTIIPITSSACWQFIPIFEAFFVFFTCRHLLISLAGCAHTLTALGFDDADTRACADAGYPGIDRRL